MIVMEQVAWISKNCGKIQKFGLTLCTYCIQSWNLTTPSNNALKFSSDWYLSILEHH
jgi:hypothetical protein